MENQTKGDLILNGSGKIGGGTFNRVIINGSGTISSDIECLELECNGSGKINGNVVTKRTRLHGSTKISGDLFSKEVNIHGHGTIGGNISFHQLKIKGAAKINKSLKGEQLSMEGSIKIGGDCEAESVFAEGAFQINGLLNADKIDIALQGRSFAKEIGGETITVKKQSGIILLDKFIKAFNRSLHTDLIEGDHIYLEYTKAKVVRGNHIVAGPGCEIDLVEYKQEFRADKSATVIEKRKIE